MKGLIILCLMLVSPLTLGDTVDETMLRAYQAYHAKDFEAARTLWGQAAQAGDTRALMYLGHLYQAGLGVASDVKRALDLYTRAAEQGLPDAQYQVGLMHELGQGIEADPGRAQRWYQQAMNQGYCLTELSKPGAIEP